MKKIIMHWTAGGLSPSFYDKQFYHFLVDSKGGVHNGVYAPEANLDVKSGRYAAHCGGGNTGAIGVALCGMAGFKSKSSPGHALVTKIQLEAFLALCARLSLRYNIEVSPKTVLTHYEFGVQNPKTASAGKVDIVYLPPYPEVSAQNVGGFLRAKIIWYRGKIQEE